MGLFIMTEKKKIAVYTIAKNEERNAEQWLNNVKDADGVFILDTGSTDTTFNTLALTAWGGRRVNKAEERVQIIQASIQPFRFDTARQMILNQIPDDYDLAVFLDLDERLEPEWYDKLQGIMLVEPEATEIHFRMIYSRNDDGTPQYTYDRLQAHHPTGYYWKYPIHEVLVAKEGFPYIAHYSGIEVSHHPDESKPRDYLPMLLSAVEEYPEDSRCANYLGKEYMAAGAISDALVWFKVATQFETNNFQKAEQYIAMGQIFETQREYAAAESHYQWAMYTAPNIRETWAALTSYHLDHGNFYKALSCVIQMFDITAPTHSIIRNDTLYNEWPHHMAAKILWQIGDTAAAKTYIRQAFNLAPQNVTVVRDMCDICNIKIDIKQAEKVRADLES